MQVILVCLQPFSRNSVLKCALHPKIAKNSLKTSFWEVQNRSRSSMLINPKSLSPVLVMVSRMYVPICNRFHIIRANNSKMTSFLGGYPSLTPSFEGSLHRFDTVHECDRWTDRQTPRRWQRRAKHSAFTHKNPLRTDKVIDMCFVYYFLGQTVYRRSSHKSCSS